MIKYKFILDLGDQPHNDEQNNDNNYVPDFLSKYLYLKFTKQYTIF